MNNYDVIRKLILSEFGKFMLIKDAAKLVRLKEETLYKKLRLLPDANIFFKQRGFIIIDVEKFLDFFILKEY
ncbi:MAG: hypothetical protein ACRCYT_03690 [Cetobacterium sp.]